MVARGKWVRRGALGLGIALGVIALPAMAEPRHDRGRNHGRGEERWDRHRGYERHYVPRGNYSVPLFGFGLFGPPVAMRPQYYAPPPVYYPPPPRGYYPAPPPAYYGY